jgi:4-hydroxy-3-polyprenylbenzoate decarboxylase
MKLNRAEKILLLSLSCYDKMTNQGRKIIIAVTGASGSVYAFKLIEKLTGLNKPPAEIAVIFSDNAKLIWDLEIGVPLNEVPPVRIFDNKNLFVPFASGSSEYDTMIICPSSMGTIGRIANGISDDLICRAADVTLKERRRLILVPRESPYNLIHIQNMEKLTLAGAVICPASPSFYSRPLTIADLVLTVIDRIISLSGFEADTYRWMLND